MVPEHVFALNFLKYPVQVASTVFPNRVPLMVVPSCVIVSVTLNAVLHPQMPVFIHSDLSGNLAFFLPSCNARYLKSPKYVRFDATLPLQAFALAPAIVNLNSVSSAVPL